jgi:hypothetical protein
VNANQSEPRPSPKQARILAGAVRALNADQQRAGTADKQLSHERQSRSYVLVPRMNIRGDVQEPGR